MWPLMTKPLDWFVIQTARFAVHSGKDHDSRSHEVYGLLNHADFFCDFVDQARDVTFFSKEEFCFTSPIATPWRENNTVYGRLHTCGRDWQKKPVVILLHGWNGETGYRLQFPFLAWRLVRRNMNVAMFELPYHARRKPKEDGAITNFISGDIATVLEATRQSMADGRALLGWLLAQGCPRVGFWGISLGAWLSGLLACHEPRTGFAALLTPIVRMSQAINELSFCYPLRESLRNSPIQLSKFDLESHRLKIPPENILLVESMHDLFTPVEPVETLWKSWNKPEIWRLKHGHISVLMALPTLERVMRWIGERGES